MTATASPQRRLRARVAPLLAVTGLMVVAWAEAGADPTTLVESVAFIVAGFVLLWRRPREPIGWLLVLIALSFIPTGMTLPGSASDIVDGRLPTRLTVLAWFNAWGSVVFFGALAAVAAIFPAGRLPAGRMGRVVAAAIVAPALFAVALAVAPEMNTQFADGTSGAVRNPIALFAGWSGWPVVQVGVYVAVLLFAALVVALQAALAPFTRSNSVAIAASTLAAAASFQPLLRRVRRVVDRRFNRAAFDADREAAGFAGQIRDRADARSVTDALAAALGRTIQPSSAGVWLRDPHR